MFRTPVIAALTLLIAAPSLPQSTDRPAAATEVASDRPIETIRWTYDDERFPGGSTRQLRFLHDRSESSVEPVGDPDVQRIIDTIQHAAAGQPLSFGLSREAGALACTGEAGQDGRGAGTCRFNPSARFAAELSRRGIAPNGSDEMLALTLVDAHLATVEALTGSGFRFDDAGDLIAVTALDIDAAYANELRGAGLRIDKLGDLIAAKALKIDAKWLREMGSAGYPNLAVGQAIQMRALGVTPDYAMKMDRVLRAAGEIQ
jgi:hypothetical protein